jgi:hypothetical protein
MFVLAMRVDESAYEMYASGIAGSYMMVGAPRTLTRAPDTQLLSDLEDLGTETVPLTAVDISTPPLRSCRYGDVGG